MTNAGQDSNRVVI